MKRPEHSPEANPLRLKRHPGSYWLHAVSSAGEYPTAPDILLEALSKTPRSTWLLNQLASVQQDLGEYLEAERSYLRALGASSQTEGDPEQLVILQNLATLYLDTGQYSKGERAHY